MALTPRDFQQLLIEHGFPLPVYGADGDYGEETAAACEEWFASGEDLALEPDPAPPAGTGLVPADWMPECKMERIIIHWTAGSYAVSATDREHYHIIVDGDGGLERGDKSIKANVSTSDNDGYAAHTKNCNSGSIGISAACMAGATEADPGAYPLTRKQWEVLAQVAADLCNTYSIQVNPQNVLQHGEVSNNLGIAQDGKWDICFLPWSPDMSDEAVGDQFRDMVLARL